MATTRVKYGIPDVELFQDSGVSVNLHCFAGHVLVVLFCPADAASAANELTDFAAHASDFADNDAWVVAVREEGEGLPRNGYAAMNTVFDPAGLAWRTFAELAYVDEPLKMADGATFLFGRGGALLRVWSGPANASNVLREITERHDNGSRLSSR